MKRSLERNNENQSAAKRVRSDKNQENVNTYFLNAARNGDKKEVLHFLSLGADVNAQNPHGITALHYCAMENHLTIAQILISNGANLDTSSNGLSTSLHFAVIYENIDMVRLLVKNHANVNKQDLDGQTPLHIGLSDTFAIENNSAQTILRILLEAGTDIYLVDKTGKSTLSLIQRNAVFFPILRGYLNRSLSVAVQNGNTKKALALLEDGACPNVTNSDGVTALHNCAKRNYPIIAQALINKVANLDAQTSFLSTPLHFAVINKNIDMVLLLVKNQANVNLRDLNGQTPLYQCLNEITQNDGKLIIIAGILLEAGSDLSHVDNTGKSAFSLVKEKALEARLSKIRVLYKGNKELSQDKEANLSKILNEALLSAAKDGDENRVIYLLESGASAFSKTSYPSSFTALHYCAQNNLTNAAKKLILKGAELDVITTTEGCETPLHFAVIHQAVDMVLLLVENQANVNFQDLDGQTPLHRGLKEITQNNENLKVITEILLEAGTDIHLVDNTGKSTISLIKEKSFLAPLLMKYLNQCLLKAAKNREAQKVITLLEDGANPNAQDNHGTIALHSCARNNHTIAAQMLINKGANIHATTKTSSTPLHLAVIYGNAKMVSLLVASGANVNHQNDFGHTPLHMGLSDIFPMKCKIDLKLITEILLEAGTDISLVDKTGKSTLSLMQKEKVLAPVLVKHYKYLQSLPRVRSLKDIAATTVSELAKIQDIWQPIDPIRHAEIIEYVTSITPLLESKREITRNNLTAYQQSESCTGTTDKKVEKITP